MIDNNPKYLHSKEIYGIMFHTNKERIYMGQSVSPWDKKGQERGMTKSDIEEIILNSDMKQYGINIKDSLKVITDKLKKQGVTDIELVYGQIYITAKIIK